MYRTPTSATTTGGDVTVWEPGGPLVHTFALAMDQAAREVAVEFVAGDEPERCTVQFAHGGWTETNAAVGASSATAG